MALYSSKSVELQLSVTETLEQLAKEEANRPELTERGVRHYARLIEAEGQLCSGAGPVP